MELSLPIPDTFTRTGPPSDSDGTERPSVDPFDVAWMLSILVYALFQAAHASGKL